MIKILIFSLVFSLSLISCSGTEISWTDLTGLGSEGAIETEEGVENDADGVYGEEYGEDYEEEVDVESGTEQQAGNAATEENNDGEGNYTDPNDTVVSIPVTMPKQGEDCDPNEVGNTQAVSLRVDGEAVEIEETSLTRGRIRLSAFVEGLPESIVEQDPDVEFYECVYDEAEDVYFWEILAKYKLHDLDVQFWNAFSRGELSDFFQDHILHELEFAVPRGMGHADEESIVFGVEDLRILRHNGADNLRPDFLQAQCSP